MDTVESAVIHGYHAHINFDPETRDIAVAMREELGSRFDVVLGRVWDKPVGPHVKSIQLPLHGVGTGAFVRVS